MPENRSPTTASPPPPPSGAAGRRWRSFSRWIWPFAVAALIFFASSRSHVRSPGLTRVDDKIAHFAVYGLLGTLVCRAGGGWRGAVWSLVAVSAFGASDEWHQSYVPGRMSDVMDWVADTLGAALAIGLYAGWPWYRNLLEGALGGRRKAG